MEGQPGYKPWIRRSAFHISLVCALVPMLAVVGLQFATLKEQDKPQNEVTAEMVEVGNRQIDLVTNAHAQRIGQELRAIGLDVKSIAQLAAKAFATPEIFAPLPDAPNPLAEALGDTSSEDEELEPIETSKYIDNPLFYSETGEGIFTKLIKDGPAVFYPAPSGVEAKASAMQRVVATALADPSLVSTVESHPLCSYAYIVSADNLLRIFPEPNFSGWDRNKDLTGLSMYAWSPDKADENGLVWTSPYVSHISGTWVIACTAQINVGGTQIGISGCEIELSRMEDEALSFSLGQSGHAWIARQDGVGLAAQSGVLETYGLQALSSAEIPTDKNPAPVVLDRANIFRSGFTDAPSQFGAQGETLQPRPGENVPGTGIFTAARQLGVANLYLLGSFENSQLTQVIENKADEPNDYRKTLIHLILAALLAGICAAAGAWMIEKRIAGPMAIVTERLEEAARSDKAVTVAIADEGELGRLAHAAQKLVDRACSNKDTSATNAMETESSEESNDKKSDDDSNEESSR